VKYALSLLLAYTLISCSELPLNIETYTVERGDFVVKHFEGGEVRAAHGEVIMSPRISGRLKITDLAPEGGHVEIGDLIIQFDPAEFEDDMRDREGRLFEAQSNFEKAKAQRNQRLSDIKRKIELQEATFRLAELNIERQRFASPIDQEQSRIAMEKGQRAVSQAREDSIAQEVINRVDFQSHQLSISRRRERYDRARDNYERTRVTATKPGIVVYRKIRKPGSSGESKVAVGDNIWGGHALIDLPDLSKMQVRCLVGEMDIKRVRVGQKVSIRLEAFIGPVFHGKISNIAPMATPQPEAKEIRVFEMFIDIDEQDERLKPGMSAEAEIELERLSNVLSVPLAAIVDRGDTKLIYRVDGSTLKPVEVELGRRNSSAAIVKSGLEEGDLITLTPSISGP
jgi:HlyD family secretion protein